MGADKSGLEGARKLKFLGYHKMTIRNGYGIEKILSDSETKEIIDNAFIPSFRKDEYYQGTLNGLNKLMDILRKRWVN